MKPLIFQGLININPDLDDIFYLTRKKFNNSFIFKSISSYPLFYFPNNYVPINSKNNLNLIKNKINYFALNKFLDILYQLSEKEILGNPLELFNELIAHLIANKLLVKKDLDIYKIYLNDLISIGYNFTSLFLLKNQKKNYSFLKTFSEFKLYIIFIRPLGGKERKNVLNFLYSAYNQVTVHPVKFSNISYQYKIYQYILFINSNEY